MCQLTFVNGDNQKIISTLSGLLLHTNGSSNNPDGWGVFDENNNIYKSALAAHKDPELEYIVKDYGYGVPIVGHVRLSSVAYNRLAPDAKNSHPFESEHYVVVHNGTLGRWVGEINSPGITDSYDFTLELEKHYDEPFLQAIRATYACFRGTFAFIIFEKLTGSYYICRGDTKPLHKVHVKATVGKEVHDIFIVNTSTETLNIAVNVLDIVLKLYSDTSLEIVGVPALIGENTINVFNPELNDIVLLGDMHEVSIPKNPVVYTQGGAWTNEPRVIYTTPTGNSFQPPVEGAFELGWRFASVGLSFDEVQMFYYKVYGDDLIEHNNTHVKESNDYLKIWPLFTESKIKYWKLIIKNWKLLNPSFSPLGIYDQYKLQFPYGFNDKAALKRALVDIKEKLKNRKFDEVIV